MRGKLCDIYKTERQDICKRIIKILDLDENHSFLLSELDDNLEKQNAILNMKEEIQKCFAVSQLGCFKPGYESKRPYLSIVRGILRKEGYTFISSDINIKVNNVFKRTQRYIIFRELVGDK